MSCIGRSPGAAFAPRSPDAGPDARADPAIRSRLLLDTRGVSAVEYLIVILLVVVASIGIWRSLGRDVMCSVQRGSGHLHELLGGQPGSVTINGCVDPALAQRSSVGADSTDSSQLEVATDSQPSSRVGTGAVELPPSEAPPSTDLNASPVDARDDAGSGSGGLRASAARVIDSAAGFVSGFVPYGSIVVGNAPLGNERAFAQGQFAGAVAGLGVDAAMIGGGLGAATVTAPAIVTGPGAVVPASGLAVAAAGMGATPGHLLNMAKATESLASAENSPASKAGRSAGAMANKGMPTIPRRATETLEHVRQTGQAPAGQVGGRVFRNDGSGGGRVLPPRGRDGSRITYREFDINPHAPGVNRGAERIVVGSDGRAWYTADHYTSFLQM